MSQNFTLKEAENLQAKLAEPDLFTRDPESFQATATALSQAEAKLAQAEEDWLELELKREGIEGG